ncbi:hypothetical protein PENTCL1PPCAC_12050 [Pristionchus entomophagus]|uniref:Uncharacterized protein n=1 Tax=Pristionchus entomophagus TaxID=358040 RepID=A0AAV5T460_9BILA|nr:hypothetical protein PENTCL1PPCAC_12050 [Pristionchus entomophagus]
MQQPQAAAQRVIAAPKHQPPVTVQKITAPIKQQPAAAAAQASPPTVQHQHPQQKPVKSEVIAPRTPRDPAEVKILSTNLVSLNNQIDYVNKIKDLAQAQKLPSEYLYKAVEPLADPSPDFFFF